MDFPLALIGTIARVNKKPEPRGIVRYLSDDDRNRLLEACRESEYKPLYLLVLFALTTGMRGEKAGERGWSPSWLPHQTPEEQIAYKRS